MNVALFLLYLSGYRFFACGGARSDRPCACSCGSCSPWSAYPRGTPGDDRPRYGLHRRHAGGRPGSWPHREPSGERRASAQRRPCPACAGCARCWTGGAAVRDTPCASRRSADAAWRTRPSRATSCTDAPALRTICAPLPGRSSTQWTTLPTGMLRSGRALPALIGASRRRDCIWSPGTRPWAQ